VCGKAEGPWAISDVAHSCSTLQRVRCFLSDQHSLHVQEASRLEREREQERERDREWERELKKQRERERERERDRERELEFEKLRARERERQWELEREERRMAYQIQILELQEHQNRLQQEAAIRLCIVALFTPLHYVFCSKYYASDQMSQTDDLSRSRYCLLRSRYCLLASCLSPPSPHTRMDTTAGVCHLYLLPPSLARICRSQ
jgi:hypothetical protein